MTTTTPTSFEDNVAKLEAIAEQLVPLVAWLKELRGLQDDVIKIRLTAMGEPWEVRGREATTTAAGYEKAVRQTLEADDLYHPAFDALTTIACLVELELDLGGLGWTCDDKATV